MKRTLKLRVLLGLMAMVALLFASEASAANPGYQVVSDSTFQIIVNGSPTGATTQEGCHKTALYNTYYPAAVKKAATARAMVNIQQRLVFCVKIAVDNNSYATYATDEPEIAVSWRCYSASDVPMTCGQVSANLNLHITSAMVLRVSWGCNYYGNNGWDRCMGYTGSGTFYNNAGWYYSAENAPYTVFKGNGQQSLWPDFYGYTTDETFNNVSVGGAATNHWNVYDTF